MSKLSEDFLKSFGRVETLPLSSMEEQRLGQLKETLKSYLQKRGFKPAAIDLIDLQVSTHTLVMPPQKGWQDAYHPCAGGKPFYQLCMTVKGAKIGDVISTTQLVSLADMTALQQACYFANAWGQQAGNFRLGTDPLYYMCSEKDSFVTRTLDMLSAADSILERDGIKPDLNSSARAKKQQKNIKRH